jgi:hypothetical protein
MSTKKVSSKPTPKPSPLYKNGQKVWTITTHRGKPEEIREGIVHRITTSEFVPKDELGKPCAPIISFTYRVETAGVEWFDLYETLLFPSYQSAALVFGKAFVVLIK